MPRVKGRNTLIARREGEGLESRLVYTSLIPQGVYTCLNKLGALILLLLVELHVHISSVLTTQATMYMYIHGCWLMIEAKLGAVNLKHIAQEQVLLLGSH